MGFSLGAASIYDRMREWEQRPIWRRIRNASG